MVNFKCRSETVSFSTCQSPSRLLRSLKAVDLAAWTTRRLVPTPALRATVTLALGGSLLGDGAGLAFYHA